jgi:hypothetical protein
MKYRVFTSDGYIISIQHNAENGNTTEEEYLRIMEAIQNKPIAPEGYEYRLTEGLELVLYKTPVAVETTERMEAESDV